MDGQWTDHGQTMQEFVDEVADSLHEVNMTWEGEKAKFTMQMAPVQQYFKVAKEDAQRKFNLVLARAKAGIKYVDDKLKRVEKKHEQSMGLFDQLQLQFHELAQECERFEQKWARTKGRG